MGSDREAGLDRQYEKRLRRLGLSLETIQVSGTDEGVGGIRITDVRFKLDADGDTGVLVILKAREGADKLVAFVGGLSMTDVVIATAKKLSTGALRWREDRPWGE